MYSSRVCLATEKYIYIHTQMQMPPSEQKKTDGRNNMQHQKKIFLSENFINIFYEKYFKNYGDIIYNEDGKEEFRPLDPILWVTSIATNTDNDKETMYDFYLSLTLHLFLLTIHFLFFL